MNYYEVQLIKKIVWIDKKTKNISIKVVSRTQKVKFIGSNAYKIGKKIGMKQKDLI